LHSSCWCAAWVLSRVQCVGRHSHHAASREVLATRPIILVYNDTPHKFTCTGYARLLCQVALMHGAYGVMLYDDPLTTLNQQAVQPASRCHNISRTGIMVLCCSIKQESHLAAASDWCRFSCLTFNDVCHLTEIYMQHRQPDPCRRVQQFDIDLGQTTGLPEKSMHFTRPKASPHDMRRVGYATLSCKQNQ